MVDAAQLAIAEKHITITPPNQRLDMLMTLPYGALTKIAPAMTPEEQRGCDVLQIYQADTVGRIMHPLLTSTLFSAGMTVGD